MGTPDENLSTEGVVGDGASTDRPPIWAGHEVGGPFYLHHYPELAYPYLAIVCLAVVAGTLGNSLVLFTIYVYRPLRHHRNAFVFNLALADLCVSGFADPFSIVGMVRGKVYFDSRPGLCNAIATICLMACVAALFSIGGVGFSQYIHICNDALYRKVFTCRNNILLCASFWLLGLTVSSPALFGWMENVYDPKYLECIWNRKFSFSFTIFFSTFVVALPVCIICASYVKLFLRVRDSKRKIAARTTAWVGTRNTTSSAVPMNQTASVRLARTLSMAFLAFVICWAPYAILVVADFSDAAPMEVHLFVLLLAHLHSSVNCAIYAVTNIHFRKGFEASLARLLGRRGPNADLGLGGHGNTQAETVFQRSTTVNPETRDDGIVSVSGGHTGIETGD